MGDVAKRFGPAAVVTGASDGIGRAIAHDLAAAGLDLVLVSRRASELGMLAGELRERHGARVTPLAFDLGRREELARLVEETRAQDIGLLVAAAGFGTSGPLLETDLETELDLVAVNCSAVLALTHTFGRRFATRGRGGIVLFGSLVGWQGTPYAANYAASKAYVQSLAEGLRVELAPRGVEVLAAAPGPVNTGFARRADLRLGTAISAEKAARAIIAALGRAGTVVPGAAAKFLTWSLKPLPRRLRVRIMGQVMKGMTRHHGDRPAATR